MTTLALLLALSAPNSVPLRLPDSTSRVVAFQREVELHDGQREVTAIFGTSRCWNLPDGEKLIQLDTTMPPNHLGGAPGVGCEWEDEILIEHACSHAWLIDEWLVYPTVTATRRGVACYYKPPAPAPTPCGCDPGTGTATPTPAPRPTPVAIRMQAVCRGRPCR